MQFAKDEIKILSASAVKTTYVPGLAAKETSFVCAEERDTETERRMRIVGVGRCIDGSEMDE